MTTLGAFLDSVRATVDDFESIQIDERHIGGDDDVDTEEKLAELIMMLNERCNDL